MATAEPEIGKEGELEERMKSFANALRRMPGLVNVLVLREEGTKNLVGISLWQDRNTFESAMDRLAGLFPKSNLTKTPPAVRQFVEVA